MHASGALRYQITYQLLVGQVRKYQKKVDVKPIKKILVANRGEIAVRIFRACNELGIAAVAIYSKEDRLLSHRIKADESYEVGEGLSPVNAYMNSKEIIRVCLENNVDAVHPGYGFLSEKPEFAQSVVDAGLRFIGPTPEVVQRMSDKVYTRQAAQAVQIPVIPGTEKSVATSKQVKTFTMKYGYPIMIKPSYGMGGKGLYIVRSEDKLEETMESAVQDAEAHFGDTTLYLEKYLENVRHIEVQVVGDKVGNVIHLYERDCSLQRLYQKLVEVAPAPNFDPKIRDQIVEAAVKLAKSVKLENLGNVEFLVDTQAGRFYFMEVNARIQVQHTVTEEITNIDLIHTQIRIAEGYSLPDLNLDQDKIQVTGYAVQTRITTEDPKMNFTPDSGRIEVFRSGEGMGIRLDGASGFAGAVITPYYDPMLVKITSHAQSVKAACLKMDRALREFRIRGVKTNIPFLVNIVRNSNFRKGLVTTNFIEENPKLLVYKSPKNRGQKLLNYLADVLVNGPTTPFLTKIKPPDIKPSVPAVHSDAMHPPGLRDILKGQGPRAFAKAVRNSKSLLLTDTTFRDAHQSLLLTRVRTYDLARIAPYLTHEFNNFYSLEMWGGGTFDTALRFLHECPWERVTLLRSLIPNIPFQMLLRGANALGYTNYPDNVVFKFCELAVKVGIDIFRVFDSLNYLPNLKMGIEAAMRAGGVVEGAICYSGDVSNPDRTKYNLRYYMHLTDELIRLGIHVLCIKDMAGLLKPKAGEILISALRERHPDIPIHVHTHDTSGAGVASMLACATAGADVVDVAVDSMSGITSQPSMGAIVACLQGTSQEPVVSLSSISKYSAYWEQTRMLYAPFEVTTTMKSGNADVYTNEIPGAQYTHLQYQAYSLGLGDLFEEVKAAYAEANILLGDLIKVLPSSRVVGDLAQFMVQNRFTAKDINDRAEELSLPNSVVEFFLGAIGEPYGGFPEPLRTKVIKNRTPFQGRPGASLPPLDFDKLKDSLRETYPEISDYDVMSVALYPDAARDFLDFREIYGPVDKLNTRMFLVGPNIGEEFQVTLKKGKVLEMKSLAVGDCVQNDGRRQVFFELNGTSRVSYVKDRHAGKEIIINPKAEKSNKKQIPAPMPGIIENILIKAGDVVGLRDAVMVITAMKMEVTVYSPLTSTVKDVHVKVGQNVEAGDLVITLD